MKRPLCSPPESFALAPLITLLPVEGSVRKLEALSTSLYARLEKVQGTQKESQPVNQRRVSSEGAMLKQILEWLTQQKDDAPKGGE